MRFCARLVSLDQNKWLFEFFSLLIFFFFFFFFLLSLLWSILGAAYTGLLGGWDRGLGVSDEVPNIFSAGE